VRQVQFNQVQFGSILGSPGGAPAPLPSPKFSTLPIRPVSRICIRAVDSSAKAEGWPEI